MKWFQQKSNIAIGILFLIAFVIVVYNPVAYFPDSSGYASMHIIRAPGYPLFLQLMKSSIGVSYDVVTMFLQILFGCFAIYYFVAKLRRHQLLNEFFSVCFAFILLLPFISGLKIANNILTEAFSYALYLIIVAKFSSFFITKNKKELYYSLPILGLLLLIRYQFIYLVPIVLLLIIWVNFKQKTFKQHALLIILFISLPLITSLVDKTYHKIVHGHFVSTPWTGMNIITAAFFVADAEDVQLFNDATEKEFFSKTYTDLVAAQKNINHLDKTLNVTPTQFYIENFASITMGPIYDNGVAIFPESLTNEERFIALDKMTTNMTKPLIVDNFSKWRKIYIKNAMHGFGGLKLMLLYIFIAVCSGIALLKGAQKQYKIIGFVSLLLIANVLIVSIGMHAVVRFTFYNDWVLFLTIFILLNSLNKKLYES